jgi:hypothetical protein
MDVKNRLYRAKCRARQILVWNGFTVTLLPGGIFDIEAADEDGMKKIKICLDSVAKSDIEAVRKVSLPPFCRREIWVKESNSIEFKIIKVKNPVNP